MTFVFFAIVLIAFSVLDIMVWAATPIDYRSPITFLPGGGFIAYAHYKFDLSRKGQSK